MLKYKVGENMKIVFMGTPEFAIPSLLGLIEKNYNILAIVTQPDKPRDRGKKVKYTPVKEIALKHNISVLQPLNLRDESLISHLRLLKPDIIIVIAYGKILPKEILKIPKSGCVNVHASLLPAYRGAAPINWAIINGEKKTGVTTMYMDTGLDTGDIILKKEIEISDDMTAGQLHDLLANLGKELLLKTLEDIKQNKVNRIAQDHSKESYAPMLTKDVGIINWNHSAKSIVNLVRGTNPWPGSYTFLKGKKMKIWKTSIYEVQDGSGKPGIILDYIKNLGWIVKTGKGLIAIEEIQMPSGKKMSVDSYIRGHDVNIGTVLGEGGC